MEGEIMRTGEACGFGLKGASAPYSSEMSHLSFLLISKVIIIIRYSAVHVPLVHLSLIFLSLIQSFFLSGPFLQER